MNDPVNVPLRVGLLFVLLVSSAVSTALPVLLSIKFAKSVKKDGPLWRKLLLSCLNCFAGGVFLAVTFLHLLPDLSESWGIILSEVWPSDYPFNNFLVVLGFFLILVIEQIAHTCQNKKETALLNNTDEVNDTTALVSSAEPQYGSSFTSPNQKNSENKPVNTPSGRQSTLRALFLAVALSVHSVFEGLAFGLIQSDSDAVQLFIGVVIHKTVIGLSLGIAFVTSQSKIWLSLVLTFIFVMSSPVGIAIGLGIRAHPGDSTGSLIASAILEALACGTFAYITFLELIGHEFSNVQSAIARHRLGLVLCAILGFSLIAGLTFLPG